MGNTFNQPIELPDGLHICYMGYTPWTRLGHNRCLDQKNKIEMDF